MIHDGVRPFVTQEEIEACRDAAIREGASVLGVPVKDTIKQVNGKGLITGTRTVKVCGPSRPHRLFVFPTCCPRMKLRRRRNLQAPTTPC